MTVRDFQRRATALFLRANPGATVGEWTVAPRRVVYPTGLQGIAGRFTASCPGFRSRDVIADWDPISGLATR